MDLKKMTQQCPENLNLSNVTALKIYSWGVTGRLRGENLLPTKRVNSLELEHSGELQLLGEKVSGSSVSEDGGLP